MKIKSPNRKIILPLIFALTSMYVITVPKDDCSRVHADEISNAVAQVGDKKYNTYFEAWMKVINGGTVTMLKDWNIGSSLTVFEDANITVNMNGHMINRNLSEEDEYGNVFVVEENATLNLNGNNVNDTVHYGNIVHSKWTYQESDEGNIPIHGSLITGGYSEDGGGAIRILDDANVFINDVNIVGNASGNGEYGGAIYVEGDDVTLNISNSNISYNLINDGYGGGLYSEGSDGSIYIDESKFTNNVGTKSSDGGAIYIEDGAILIFDSQISYNTTGRRGGAIYTYGGVMSINRNSVISHNYADEEGGAIYVGDGSSIFLSGKVIGNNSRFEGGAIYVNANSGSDEGILLLDVEIMGNASLMNGGGIYVDSDDDIGLQNRVEIYSNSPNNLYILDEEAICLNRLTSNSNIGIATSWDANKEDPVLTSNQQYFFSDKLGKSIIKCDEGFYYQTSEAPSTKEYKVGNSTYPIVEGIFRYNYDLENSYLDNFYYSDGYFASHPKYYNEHLSTFALALTMATMTADYENDFATEASRNASSMLEQIGYKDMYIDFEEPEYYGDREEDISTIGYIIASKEVEIEGNKTTIVITSIRGGTYYSEWASNFTMGDGNKEHDGFRDAANKVKQGLNHYLSSRSIDTNNTKFLVTGYSRSAATANILSKELTDIYGENKVYGYCFATPKGGVESELKEGYLYNNIHNIINKTDIIPCICPSEMGFIRYGIDRFVPGHLVGTEEYENQKIIMMNHLQLFNPTLEYDDYFHEATLEYIGSTIDFLNIMYDLIDENYFTEHDYAEHWSPYLIEKLQEYSFNDMLSDVDLKEVDLSKEPYKSYIRENEYNRDSKNFLGYRNFYANYKWYIYFDGNTINNGSYDIQPSDYSSEKYTTITLQNALTNVVNFYFSASEEKIEQLMATLDLDAIMEKINKFDIYLDIIGVWHELNIEQKNVEFNKLWTQLDLETPLKKVLNDEEMHMIKTSLYVIVDFLLDFVSEDYVETDQDVLGTLIYNVANIFNTHTTDIAYAWVKSYDSFYTTPSFKCSHNVRVDKILQEATETENGVKEYTCLICGSNSYEVIEKLPTNDKGVASLIGNGSILAIVTMSCALLGAGVSIFFYVKTKKLKK